MSTKDKKIQVFNYIKSRLNEGTSPSVREIMDAMDFHSTSTAHRYIEMLVADGLLEKTDNLNRTLRLPNSSTQRMLRPEWYFSAYLLTYDLRK